jgi:hypothetical protein
MRTHAKSLAATLAIALALGCATQEGNEQALGAVLGGAAGGTICAIAGGNSAECVASAAGGALVGWGIVKVKQTMEKRTELAQNASKPAVLIRNYQIDPPAVAPGQAMTASTTYDLLSPKSVGPRPVTQTFKIQTLDGKEVNTFTPMQGQMKEQGRYEVGWEIPIPKKAPPGQYQLVQVLDAQTASPEVRAANFEVVKKVSWVEWLEDWRG